MSRFPEGGSFLAPNDDEKRRGLLSRAAQWKINIAAQEFDEKPAPALPRVEQRKRGLPLGAVGVRRSLYGATESTLVDNTKKDEVEQPGSAVLPSVSEQTTATALPSDEHRTNEPAVETEQHDVVQTESQEYGASQQPEQPVALVTAVKSEMPDNRPVQLEAPVQYPESLIPRPRAAELAVDMWVRDKEEQPEGSLYGGETVFDRSHEEQVAQTDTEMTPTELEVTGDTTVPVAETGEEESEDDKDKTATLSVPVSLPPQPPIVHSPVASHNTWPQQPPQSRAPVPPTPNNPPNPASTSNANRMPPPPTPPRSSRRSGGSPPSGGGSAAGFYAGPPTPGMATGNMYASAINPNVMSVPDTQPTTRIEHINGAGGGFLFGFLTARWLDKRKAKKVEKKHLTERREDSRRAAADHAILLNEQHNLQIRAEHDKAERNRELAATKKQLITTEQQREATKMQLQRAEQVRENAARRGEGREPVSERATRLGQGVKARFERFQKIAQEADRTTVEQPEQIEVPQGHEVKKALFAYELDEYGRPVAVSESAIKYGHEFNHERAAERGSAARSRKTGGAALVGTVLAGSRKIGSSIASRGMSSNGFSPSAIPSATTQRSTSAYLKRTARSVLDPLVTSSATTGPLWPYLIALVVIVFCLLVLL
ncbi:MAG TPA: hypothetical protein VMB52_02125 [Verrucomicrobiae bacterium]|nr:hypothetical protein [Verrucomicrobiae bacterium]